jgi:hypothetical protein
MPNLIETDRPVSSLAELIGILREQDPISLWVQPLSGLRLCPDKRGGIFCDDEISLIRMLLHEMEIDDLKYELGSRFPGISMKALTRRRSIN